MWHVYANEYNTNNSTTLDRDLQNNPYSFPTNYKDPVTSLYFHNHYKEPETTHKYSSKIVDLFSQDYNLYRRSRPPYINEKIPLSYQRQEKSYKNISKRVIRRTLFHVNRTASRQTNRNIFKRINSTSPQSINFVNYKNDLSRHRKKIARKNKRKVNYLNNHPPILSNNQPHGFIYNRRPFATNHQLSPTNHQSFATNHQPYPPTDPTPDCQLKEYCFVQSNPRISHISLETDKVYMGLPLEHESLSAHVFKVSVLSFDWLY